MQPTVGLLAAGGRVYFWRILTTLVYSGLLDLNSLVVHACLVSLVNLFTTLSQLHRLIVKWDNEC
jgi:hypothetical protein